MPDRRATLRYALSMPITVREDDLDSISSHAGRTLEVSTRSVQFTSDHAIRPGTPLDFTITLQAEYGSPADTYIHGSGKVVRVVQRSENQFQVSIAVSQFQISREEEFQNPRSFAADPMAVGRE